MEFNKVLFMKRNNELVGVGIKPNGARQLLTLEEAVKHASKLKKESKYAVEFINTQEKLDKFNNKKKKKKLFNAKNLFVSTLGVAVVALGIKAFALINNSFDGKLPTKSTKSLELTNDDNAIQSFD